MLSVVLVLVRVWKVRMSLQFVHGDLTFSLVFTQQDAEQAMELPMIRYTMILMCHYSGIGVNVGFFCFVLFFRIRTHTSTRTHTCIPLFAFDDLAAILLITLI